MSSRTNKRNEKDNSFSIFTLSTLLPKHSIIGKYLKN